MAQGFIIPTTESQRLEELAEDYFLVLLQKCFFQDVERDEWGAFKSCKMHDLIHDLVKEMAGCNYKVAKSGGMHWDNKYHHISFDYHLNVAWEIPNDMLNVKNLRTFLLPAQMKDGSAFKTSICQQLISRFGCLRVLDLHNLGLETLPSSVGQLIHLRYLNLSKTPLKELPNSFTKLQNLQTLGLYGCSKLQRLPTDIHKLVNIKNLNVGECRNLTHMPPGIREMTSLHKLPLFIVKHSPILGDKPTTAKLSDLNNLNSLKGILYIGIHGKLNDPLSEAYKANLTSKLRLTELNVEVVDQLFYETGRIRHDELLLEGLKPHDNLRKLEIDGFQGQKIPSWAMANNLCFNLPNLVDVSLVNCQSFQQVPSFGHLRFLKRLTLISLASVEYMELESNLYDLSSEKPFFPSLQKLKLLNMNNLKGWWKGGESDTNNEPRLALHLLVLSFSNLLTLWINYCPNLRFLPPCPNVEHLIVVDSNKTLSVSEMATASSASLSSSGFRSKTLSVNGLVF